MGRMGQAIRILLVDDEAVLAWTMNKMLTASGYSVTTFTDPLLALSASRQAPFDLLISDVRMPGLSGMELATQVRANQPECRVILLSGQANALDAMIKDQRTGFQLLRKPLRPEELLEVVGSMSA